MKLMLAVIFCSLAFGSAQACSFGKTFEMTSSDLSNDSLVIIQGRRSEAVSFDPKDYAGETSDERLHNYAQAVVGPTVLEVVKTYSKHDLGTNINVRHDNCGYIVGNELEYIIGKPNDDGSILVWNNQISQRQLDLYLNHEIDMPHERGCFDEMQHAITVEIFSGKWEPEFPDVCLRWLQYVPEKLLDSESLQSRNLKRDYNNYILGTYQ